MINRISVYLQNYFSKNSKRDGRTLILLFLAVYFMSIFLASFFMDYRSYWRLLGVPTMDTLFGDMYVITKAMECTRAGFNVYETSSCFEYIFAYPKTWFLFSSIWVSPENNLIFGGVVIVIYYAVTFLFLKRIDVHEGIFYGLLMCSPPFMLAIERCQPDLLIFTMCALAIFSVQKSGAPYLGGAILLFAGILKLYPFATILSFINDNKKKSILFVSVFSLIGALYIFFNLDDIRTLSHLLSQNFFHVVYRFSIRLHRLPYPAEHLPCIPAFFSPGTERAYRLHGSGCHPAHRLTHIKKKKAAGLDTSHLFSFHIGATIYMGSYLIGSNYDYKLIMFIFAIPQMFAWLRNNAEVRNITALALLGILITCFSSLLFSKIFYWILYSFIEESINWFIFGYFLYMFFNTMPAWLKEPFLKNRKPVAKTD
jgi:hypothetical protein